METVRKTLLKINLNVYKTFKNVIICMKSVRKYNSILNDFKKIYIKKINLFINN